ncbi:hypothetical protein BZA05DRAFT_433629 [Tricharina praecox]|uniref:uncharacterized protein n=1 Tax=Tricharina praecox TaxID=43433 RepID=UPI00221EFBAC|nr:uncharacterized protein BZA05DRAFT_433629 [Tricharina praecox]KAI5856942.1 hypothetical protein BZA05DRAFT_433629 [Tricharina praecox]
MDPPASPPTFEFRVPAPVTPRLKRRSIHTPYPQQYSIPPSPASSSSSAFTNPVSSPTSPMKPTSSLARRRRSLIMASPAVRDEDEVMSQAAAIVAEPDHNDTTETFDSIAQAMTLLSLHPVVATDAHWPDPEELLKESLRQSLAALRALREAKSVIRNIDGRRASESDGAEPPPDLEPGRNVFEVEALFESVVGDLKSAKEAIGWAEQQMEMEKGVLRERLLKG